MVWCSANKLSQLCKGVFAKGVLTRGVLRDNPISRLVSIGYAKKGKPFNATMHRIKGPVIEKGFYLITNGVAGWL